MGNVLTFDFWRKRLLEIMVAFIAANLTVQFYDSIGKRQREALPSSAWFEVNEVYVPDHEAAANPTMVYDRVIREDFTGFWIVEVQRIRGDGLFENACSGFGTNHYSVEEVIANNEVTWEWFIGRPCRVEPGEYRLRVSWSMKKPGWPEKEAVAFSNQFTVTPAGP